MTCQQCESSVSLVSFYSTLGTLSHITSVLSLVELQDSASARTTSVDALQKSVQVMSMTIIVLVPRLREMQCQ